MFDLRYRVRSFIKWILAFSGGYAGNQFYCPICGHHFGKLKPFVGSYYVRGELVNHDTPNCVCPVCNSDVRHRFLVTFLDTKMTELPAHPKVLHFAPEPGVYAHFKKRFGSDYVLADLQPEHFPAEIHVKKIDITQIDQGDSEFDLIFCSHVLEHIEDDTKACAELYRVLKSGGLCLIALPIYGTTTVDAPGLDEQARLKMFGDPTHVRFNGLDFADKLRAVGFRVRTISTDDVEGNYLDRSLKSPHVDSDKYLFAAEK